MYIITLFFFGIICLPCFFATNEEHLSLFKIFLFNYTNPEQVTFQGAKPQMEEVGPYTFLQEEDQTILEQTETSEIFDIKYRYTFVPVMSSGSLEDMIVTINPISVFMAEATRWPGVWGQDDFPFMRILLDESMKQANESLFLKTYVANLTFDGIDSPLFHMGDGDLGSAIDSLFPEDHFSYFYDKKFNTEGPFEVDSKDQLLSWKGQTDLSSVYPKPCDELTGSLGHQFPTDLVKERKPFSVFSSDTGRALNFNFQEEDNEGTAKYILDENYVGDAYINASNSCYNPCPDLVPEIIFNDNVAALMNTTNIELSSGLVNISQHMNNWPLYVSYPHFFLGDHSLGDEMDGLFPDIEKHESYIRIDLASGLVKESVIRLQYNMLVRDLEYIEMLQNVPTEFFPILWTDVSAMFPIE